MLDPPAGCPPRRAYVRDNGSPWQWPWYPWPLFVVLGLGVGLRSYALCVSFHPSRGPATMFEPYLLVPFLLAVNVILLEIGIASRRPVLLRWTMAGPMGLLGLATWTFTVPESINLRRMLLDACGCSPLFLTLAAATALYALALLRRVPHAVHWLTVAVALFTVVGPTTAGTASPLRLHPWPLVLLAAMQFWAAARTRSGLHALFAAASAVAALCIAWPHAVALRYCGAIPAHLLLLAMLLIGAVLHDAVARFLQRTAILGILIACGFVLSGEAEQRLAVSPATIMLYPGFMLVLAGAYGYWVRDRWYPAVPLLILVGWLIALGRGSYRSLHATVAGLDEIALGLACLLLGLAVSLWKLGLPQAWWARLVKPPPAGTTTPAKIRSQP